MAKPSSWSVTSAGVAAEWQALWTDLIALLPFWEGSGSNVHDYVADTDLPLQGSPSWSTTTDGGDAGVLFDATTEYLQAPVATPAEFSIVAVLEFNGIDSGDETNIVTLSEDSGNNPNEFSGQLRVRGDSIAEAYGYDGSNRTIGGVATLSTDTLVVLGISWDNGVALTLYRDGIAVADNPSVGTHYTSWTSGPVLHIGGITDGIGGTPNYVLTAIYAWDTVLTDEQMAAIAADPYGLFREDAAPGDESPTGDDTDTLTGADATATLTVDLSGDDTDTLTGTDASSLDTGSSDPRRLRVSHVALEMPEPGPTGELITASDSSTLTGNDSSSLNTGTSTPRRLRVSSVALGMPEVVDQTASDVATLTGTETSLVTSPDLPLASDGGELTGVDASTVVKRVYSEFSNIANAVTDGDGTVHIAGSDASTLTGSDASTALTVDLLSDDTDTLAGVDASSVVGEGGAQDITASDVDTLTGIDAVIGPNVVLVASDASVLAGVDLSNLTGDAAVTLSSSDSDTLTGVDAGVVGVSMTPPFGSGLVNLQRGGSLVTTGSQRGGSLVNDNR